jgi:hypothetical protein
MVPTHVQLPRAKGRVKVRQRRDPAKGTPPVGNARGMRRAAGRLLVAGTPVWDLLLAPNICSSPPSCVARVAPDSGRCSSQRSLTRHFNRGFDGVFEIVRVVRRGLVPIAEIHAIGARAHHTQSESEMARDRFRFLVRHGASRPCRYTFIGRSLLSRFAPRAGLVAFRQRFVHRCHGDNWPCGGSRMSNESVFGEQC